MCHSRRIRLYLTRLGLILSLISIMWFGWFIASVIDTDVHNENGMENSWNIFVVNSQR